LIGLDPDQIRLNIGCGLNSAKMKFARKPEPDSHNDVLIGSSITGCFCHIQPDSIPMLTSPYAYSSLTPILPLSSHLLSGASSSIARTPFPLLVDIFHPDISAENLAPDKCAKCGAYLTSETGCPFCTDSELPSTFISFPAPSPSTPLFVFLVTGNTTDLFFDGILNFPHPFLLLRYEEHFIYYQLVKSEFREFHILDSPIPPNAIISKVGSAKRPTFPVSESRWAHFNELIPQLRPLLPASELYHLVLVNSLPHTCLEEFEFEDMTVSLLSTNALNCSCKEICQCSGGYFLPNSYSLTIPNLFTVVSKSIRLPNSFVESSNKMLLFPGNLAIFGGLCMGSSRATTNLQIVLQTNTHIFCFSTSLESRSGAKNFLRDMATPNLLLVPNAREVFKTLLKESSGDAESLFVPYALKYFLLFPELTSHKSLPDVLVMRPFVVQLLPSLKIPEMVSSSICANLSVHCVLFERSIYVWVGFDVPAETWMAVIGAEKPPRSTAFEIIDVDEGFSSELWVTIRSMRALLAPFRLPVVVVPSESGKRPELLEILAVDRTLKENLLLQRYAEIGRHILL
jgi:hypothetical protein